MNNKIHNREIHLTENDLLQVVEGRGVATDPVTVESHLSDCEQCREKLESLAAGPEIWQQAASILTDNQIGETLAFNSRLIADSRESNLVDIQLRSEAIPAGPAYKVEELLQPPRHPEMLGRLEHYEVEREVGRGGMGVVVKAFDTELNRAVAIKLMAPHLASHGVARQRFAREARSAAAILHPNVIAIHGVNTESTTPWLVMPYIVGPSLEQIVQDKGALDEKDLVCFAMQIAAGLQAAHAQGLVHRDIKPANVLIESGMGRVVITDFGLARAECDASMTQTGWFAGTPNFMSPEQARGVEIDHRSDLFSLGSVMYYMATGKLPFRAEQTMAIFERIREHRAAPVRRSNPAISKTVSNLIENLLAKAPSNRVQSAGEVQQVLEQYLAHLHHPDAKKMPVVKSPLATAKSKQRLRNIWLALAVSVLAVGSWLTVTYWPSETKPLGDQNTAVKSMVTLDQIVSKHKLEELADVSLQMDELNSEIDALEQELKQGSIQNPSNLFGVDPWFTQAGGLSQQINALESELEQSTTQPKR